jgi:hypothetical protein
MHRTCASDLLHWRSTLPRIQAFLRTLPATLWWITLTFALVAALTQFPIARIGMIVGELQFTFGIA